MNVAHAYRCPCGADITITTTTYSEPDRMGVCWSIEHPPTDVEMCHMIVEQIQIDEAKVMEATMRRLREMWAQ